MQPKMPDASKGSSHSRAMVAIGKITKPHGIRGEINIHYLTDFPERFYDLDSLTIEKPDGSIALFGVERIKLEHETAKVKLRGVDDRNAAELLRGSYISVSADETVELDSDQFYIYDLIGLQVFDTNDILIGTIKDIEQYPANDVLVVATSDGPVMIPAVKAFMTQIDVEAGRMTVTLPDGLLPGADSKGTMK